MGTFAVCGLPQLAAAYAPLQVPGFAKVKPPHPFRDLGTGTDAELIARRAAELREAIVARGPGDGVGGDPGARALVGRLHHAAHRLAARGARDLRRAGRPHDRRRGHHRLRAHRALVRLRARRTWCPISCRWPRASRRATSRCPPASRAAHLADAFADDSTQENVHPNTYAAHPVACAAALATIRIMEQDKLVENAERHGPAPARRPAGRARPLAPSWARCVAAASWSASTSSSRTAPARPWTPKTVADLDRKAWDRGAIVYARGNVLAAGAAALHHGRRGGRARRRGGGQRERSGPRPQQRRGSVTVSDTAPDAGS